jgi:hypothetical protein
MALFKIIESGTSPQQIAANEHLMKCETGLAWLSPTRKAADRQ